MATGFSVFVNIGGKVSPSLAAAVAATKSQVNSLGASLAAISSRGTGAFTNINKTLDTTAKRMANVQRVGRNMALGVTTPAAWFGASMVKDAVEFQKAGNMVEALGEATKEQRNQLAGLSQDLAKRYDAGGATGIMKSATELLKAGFTFEQAKGAFEQVLAASALAGDMTPADVGASLSKTVTQFAMPMKTYEQAMKSSTVVTDRMVYAAVSTVASMKDVAETFKYAGGVASTTGNSLESVTAMTMAFAKAGVLGSEAGVALRSAIVRLVKMPKGGMAALDRIGMKLGDYTTARPVTADTVIGNLKTDGMDLSGQKKQIAAAIAKNKGNHGGMAAAVTKIVQGAIGSSSALDASKISESVNDALAAAGSKVDITKFMTDLKKKVDDGVATTGDIAQILEARHISRYMALLKADLPALVKEVIEKSDGYSQKQYQVANQGLPAQVLKLDAAWKQLKNTIVESVGEEISSAFDMMASKLEDISKNHKGLLKVGVAMAAVTAAAGPLMFALGSIGRLGALAFLGVSRGLMLMLAPMNLALAGVVALARGIVVAGGAALLFGARLRGVLAAMAMLRFSTIALAGVSALSAGLAAAGAAILRFPIVALRAIGTALIFNPVGLVITAIVVALTALGVWVANNWEGIKNFFGGFGGGFMAGLKPAEWSIKTIVDSLGSMVNWLTKMLGPLNQTNEGWREWGGSIGVAAAEGFNKVVSAIQSVIGFLGQAIDKAISFGNAIRNLASGVTGGGLFTQGIPKPSVEGARALGGSVGFGKPYLVGERGPEIFVPGQTGRIETNDTLRSLTANGATAVAGASSSTTTSSRSNTAQVTVHVQGGDPEAVGRAAESAVYRVFARLESEQRGLLSD